jgi:ectoine hydroxylase-related dioxygenase (phytanoyl-CoA dioxygenase family)
MKNKIKEFHENGFVIFEDIINKRDLKKIKNTYKDLFNEKYQTGVVPDKIKWKKKRDKNNIPRSLCNVWKSDKNIAKIVLSRSLGKIAAKLMSWKSTRLNQDSLIWVTPKAGCINFHQDNPYQDWHTPGGVITCWIPITDTEENSGTLEYLIGSHKAKTSKRLKNFYGLNNYRSSIKNVIQKGKKKIKLMKLKKGSVVFHHGKTWHGSGYNKTNNDRISLSIHFMNGNSKFHPEIKSPYFNHYKLFGSLKMEESFFPIIWSKQNIISKFIKSYIK